MSSSRSRALGAGLVVVDLGQPGVHSGVGGHEAVDVGEPEVAADAVHHRVDGGGHQPAVAEVADIELDGGTSHPDKRVQPIGFAPLDPRCSW
jgi:hypothetical protein